MVSVEVQPLLLRISCENTTYHLHAPLKGNVCVRACVRACTSIRMHILLRLDYSFPNGFSRGENSVLFMSIVYSYSNTQEIS